MNSSILFIPISNQYHVINSSSSKPLANHASSRAAKLQRSGIGRVITNNGGICAIFKNDKTFIETFDTLHKELSDTNLLPLKVPTTLDKGKLQNNTNILVSSPEKDIIRQIEDTATIDMTSIGSSIIELHGNWSDIEEAKIETFKSIFCDHVQTTISFPPQLLQIFAGRHMANINALTDSTGTACFMNIYKGEILFVGTNDNVFKAVAVITKECSKEKVINQAYNFALDGIKCRYLLRSKQYQIWDIMNSFAVFIDINLSIGVTIYSRYRKTADEAWHALLNLLLEFYSIELTSYDDVALGKIESLIANLVCSSNVEIQVLGNNWSINGSLPEVSRIARQLETFVQFQQARAILDIHPSYHDFITGKKNGKFNKISKDSGSVIQIYGLHDSLMRIELSGHETTSILNGMELLVRELPSELCFHIPTIYHKRIIGVGGKNIQNVMKAFGVYVKFINPEEFKSIGGPIPEEMNVLARTPAKNKSALLELRREIERLTNEDFDIAIERRKFLLDLKHLLPLKEALKHLDSSLLNYVLLEANIDGSCSLILSGINKNVSLFLMSLDQTLNVSFDILHCNLTFEELKKVVLIEDYAHLKSIENGHFSVKVALSSCLGEFYTALRKTLIATCRVNNDVKRKSMSAYSLENIVEPSATTAAFRRNQVPSAKLRISTSKPFGSIAQQVLNNDSRNKLEYLLELLGLDMLKDRMKNIDLDFEMFLNLTDTDLTELGIDTVSKTKLIECIAQIKNARQTNASAPGSAINTSKSAYFSPAMSAPYQNWPKSPFNLRSMLTNNGQTLFTDDKQSQRMKTTPQSLNIEFGLSAFSQPSSPMPKSSDPKAIQKPRPKDSESN